MSLEDAGIEVGWGKEEGAYLDGIWTSRFEAVYLEKVRQEKDEMGTEVSGLILTPDFVTATTTLHCYTNMFFFIV